MDKFLIGFNEYTKNKYNYLRLKKVELFEFEKKANLYFLIPSEIYENVFDNSVFNELKKYCSKIAPSYRCFFYFDQLVVTENLIKDYLIELLATNYPFLAVSIGKSCIDVSLIDNIQIQLTVEKDITAILEKSDALKSIVISLEDEFGLETYITIKTVEVGEIKVSLSEERIVSKTSVPFLEYDFLCGTNLKYFIKPVFIESIKKTYDAQSVCGIVKRIERRIFEKDENSKFKFFKYNYRILISDFSGDMTCYFKSNEDDCKLNEIAEGDEIMFCGKVGFSERSSAYQMYAKTVYTIKIDKEKVNDILKPLPVPKTMKYETRTYEGNDFMISQNLFDLSEDSEGKDNFNCVFMAYKSVGKNFSPWQICLISFENGRCKEIFDTFVKTSNLDNVDVEYKSKVKNSKRLAEYVPDILCFCAGKTLYVKEAETVQRQLSSMAKAQHFDFNIEVQEANKLGVKNGQKFEPTLERMLKEYSITLTDDSCYSLCIAMAKLYMRVKK